VTLVWRPLLIASLVVACAGCGRTYALAGRILMFAVGQQFAPGIHEITGKPIPSRETLVVGATVTLFHELNTDGTPVRESLWHTSRPAKQDGSFELSDYATPGRKNLVGLEVSAPGFEAAYTTYTDYIDPDIQTFVVVLEKSRQ
jgi:hypothetical protein